MSVAWFASCFVDDDKHSISKGTVNELPVTEAMTVDDLVNLLFNQIGGATVISVDKLDDTRKILEGLALQMNQFKGDDIMSSVLVFIQEYNGSVMLKKHIPPMRVILRNASGVRVMLDVSKLPRSFNPRISFMAGDNYLSPYWTGHTDLT